ncbi:chorismate mutase [Terrarubrum flagellatum]|uniref:chorismate mutase n=1 Tax=Terrirubrum flagellatum TaxID=2895980 RepID=UPI0031456269
MSAAPSSAAQPSLADLRNEIDRIDETMHRLLMERGEIINTLIEIKKTAASGSAFRPGREAEMMRRLAGRHKGILPLDTVETIWRVIIGTFTYVQAPYAVHADVSGGDAAMRDSARFHFGFTVPFTPHFGTSAVIEAVATSAGDLGIFSAASGSSGGAWWRALEGEGRPKIIARLPFIERPDHPAGTPVFVIAKPIGEATVREVIVYSVRLERWRPAIDAAIAELGGSLDGSAGDAQGLSALVSIPGADAESKLSAALGASGAGAFSIHEIGSHAQRFSVAT